MKFEIKGKKNEEEKLHPPAPQYIKIKHMKDNYFLLCDEYDPVSSLKIKLSGVTEIPTTHIRLYLGNRVTYD